jgi:hypothetical protein
MPKPNPAPAPNTGDATADHGLSSVFSDIAGPNSAGVRYTPTPKPEPRRRSSKGKKPRRSITGDDRVDDVLESRGDDIRGVDSSDPFSSQNQKRNRQRQRQYIDPSTGNPLPPGQITGDPQADRNIRGVGSDIDPFSSQNQKRNRQRQYIDPYTGNPLPPGQITGDPQADRNIRGVGRDVNPPPKKTKRRPIQPRTPRPQELPLLPPPSEVVKADYPLVGLTLEDKLTRSIKLSVSSGSLKKELMRPLQELLKPENLAILTGILALWGAAHLWGAGEVADADLAALMVVTMGADGVKAMGHLLKFFQLAEGAKSEADLIKAGDEFAKFVSLVGTSSLGFLIGKAGQAVEKLSGTLSQAANNLGKLSSGLVRRGEDAIKTGSKLLKNGVEAAKKVGRQLKAEAQKAIDGIDDLLGNIFQKKRAVVGGGNVSGNQGRGRSRGGDRTLEKDYEVLRLDGTIVLNPKVAAQLIEKGIPADTVRALNKRGIPPNELNDLLNIFLKSKDAKYQLNQMPRIADTVLALRKIDVSLADIKAILDMASKQPEVLAALERMLLAPGKLTFPPHKLNEPHELTVFVEKTVKAMGNKAGADNGFLREMQIAAERLEKGHHVQMGAIKNDNGIAIGGDVVDHTTKEVIQVKTLTSRSTEGVSERANSAIEQLSGKNGEIPNEGYTQVAEIWINPNNRLFRESGRSINATLEGDIGKNIKLQNTGKDASGNQVKVNFNGFIRVVKEDGKGNALEVLNFRVQNGKIQFVPKQRSKNAISSSLEQNNLTAPTNNQQLIATAQKTSTASMHQELTAIEQLNNQWSKYRQETATITPDAETYQQQQLAAAAINEKTTISKTVNRGLEMG